jgi:hypothetical protein
MQLSCATALALGDGFVCFQHQLKYFRDVNKGQKVQQETGKVHFMFVS